eukprot:scaffold207_cov345-Pavlova_lutheri.AAC.23
MKDGMLSRPSWMLWCGRCGAFANRHGDKGSGCLKSIAMHSRSNTAMRRIQGGDRAEGVFLGDALGLLKGERVCWSLPLFIGLRARWRAPPLADARGEDVSERPCARPA